MSEDIDSIEEDLFVLSLLHVLPFLFIHMNSTENNGTRNRKVCTQGRKFGAKTTFVNVMLTS